MGKSCRGALSLRPPRVALLLLLLLLLPPSLSGVWDGQQLRPRRSAVVACMTKCRMLHQGVMRASHSMSGVSGRMEIRLQADCRQVRARW